jgi:hypothetical protein
MMRAIAQGEAAKHLAALKILRADKLDCFRQSGYERALKIE